MAKTPQPPPARPHLSQEQMRSGIERLKRRVSDIEAFDFESVEQRFDPKVHALETAIDETLSRVFGHGTTDYNRYSRAASMDNGPISMGGGHYPLFKVHLYLREGKEVALLLLGQAIRGLEEDLADAPVATPAPAATVEPITSPSRRVFLVHGHDEGAREAVARFLEKLNLEVVILHEQASRGKTVIEKIVAEKGIGFAVVLLTPDDSGSALGQTPQPRARQNVMLELGYFIGSLGREKVCALKKGEIEVPSDFGGVVYTAMDPAGAWKVELARELQAAGIEVDWNKVMT